MRFVVRFAPLLCLAAGCGFAQKPYADDPLLRGGRAVWVSSDAIPPAQSQPPAHPADRAAAAARRSYFTAMGVTATVPLSCPVYTIFPLAANAMQ